MKETIKDILASSSMVSTGENLIPRNTGISLEADKIQAIIGPRRVGKTSAMVLALNQLRQSGVPSHNLVYFNFEDERVEFQPHQLDLVLQAWQELYPDSNLKESRFFFDEVQVARGWEKFINRINETITKKIFFTGSNSVVLHKEIKSVMRGRSIAIELLPLSFREYCVFAGVKHVIYGTGKNKTVAAFQDYLIRGGYPETVNVPDHNKRIAYLQEYYNAMLLRDIIEYNQLSNYGYLRSLYRLAALSIGKTISLRRLHNHLKSMHYTVGINTIYETMDMAENAYLFKRISRFDFSESKREKSDKKIYWVDHGLLNANTSYYVSNKSLLLENAVFMHLSRQYSTIYSSNLHYYSDASGECDFIVNRESDLPLPIQVCWSLSDPVTKEREIKGLLRACQYSKAKEAWIITNDDESEIELSGVKVSIKAAWKWMLSDQR